MESFSPSKLDTYRHCPRQYKFKYVDRVKADRSGVEAALGTCVHTAFEELYEARAHGRVLTEEETAGIFEHEWAKAAAGPLAIRDARFTLEDWRRVGLECVRNYYRAYAPFDNDKTVAVEKRVGFPLDVPDPDAGEARRCRIEGFVDRLALAPDGFFEIHDYKTGGSLPTQAQKDEDWQLAIYDIAVREAWPDAPGVRLLWHYVRHGKTLVSARTPERLAALKSEIADLIRRIKADQDYVPVKSALCDWCDFRELCPLFKHPEAYEKLPPEERRHESGVKLVDELAALEAEKKALKERGAELEAKTHEAHRRLIAYARDHDVLVVAGSDHEAEVHAKQELKFPTKTAAPDKYERMENELKATPAWPAASKLDTRALQDAYQTHKLPAGMLEVVKGWLERWGRLETHESVRLRKRREAVDE